MNMVRLLDALMVEIVKLNGKGFQQVDVFTEPPFVDILWERVDDTCLRGCDDVYDDEGRVAGSRKWVVVGTQLGCFRIMDKGGGREVPAKGIQGMEEKTEQDGQGKQAQELQEVEEWKETIGGMNG